MKRRKIDLAATAGQGRGGQSTTASQVATPLRRAAEQGLPGPLVVPARRDRAVLVHRAAADRRVPDLLLRPVDDRGRLRRQLRAAAGHRDVRRVRVQRWTSRSTSAAVWSCGRCTTGRRCCSWPRSSCTCCGCSSPARSASRARPTGSSASLLFWLGFLSRLRRLLAAGRRPVRHRPADRLGDHAVHPGDRLLGHLVDLRRRVPGHDHHQPVLHRPRAAHPGVCWSR